MNSSVMDIHTHGDVTYLKFKILNNIDFVNHAVSTRHGGVSQGPELGSLNLGFTASDTKENVTENYIRFCKAAGFDVNNLVFSKQTHSDNVLHVTSADRGKGIFRERGYTDVDALITNEAGVALVIHGADCVPIVFLDTVNMAIGSAHCGWRGTYKLLAKKTLDEMNNKFGTRPENVICTIGPAICGSCYEVSEDLYLKFKDRFGFKEFIYSKGGKFYLDLMNINKQILINMGVEHIAVSDLCTCCSKNDLYSHRGLGPKRGLMSSVIEIKRKD